MKTLLSKEDMLLGLRRFDELAIAQNKKVRLSIYGGAALLLAFDGVRTATQDVDAVIREGKSFAIKAAEKVAEEKGWDKAWLNDAVKGFISEYDKTNPLDDWGNKEVGLVIEVAAPEYLLAMKCMAMRQEADAQDIGDIKFLVQECGFSHPDEVMDLVEKFYPRAQIPPKVSLGIMSIFQEIENTKSE